MEALNNRHSSGVLGMGTASHGAPVVVGGVEGCNGLAVSRHLGAAVGAMGQSTDGEARASAGEEPLPWNARRNSSSYTRHTLRYSAVSSEVHLRLSRKKGPES